MDAPGQRSIYPTAPALPARQAGGELNLNSHLGEKVDVLIDRETVNPDERPLYRGRRSGSGGEDKPPASVHEGTRGRVGNASVGLQGLHGLVH